MSQIVSLVVLALLIVLLGGMFYQVLLPFLMPLLLAGMVAIVCQPLNRYFLSRTGNHSVWAAMLTTVSLVAVVVIPVGMALLTTALELTDWTINHYPSIRQSLSLASNSDQLREYCEKILPKEWVTPALLQAVDQAIDSLGQASTYAARTLGRSSLGIAAAMTSFTISAGMFLLALFFFLQDGPKMLQAVQQMIPLPDSHQEALFNRFAVVTGAVFNGTILSALVQGLMTSSVCWFLGFGHFFTFTILATISAMIPLAGTWIVWVPCAIILFFSGHVTWAILLVLWGIIAIGLADNVIRTYLLNGDAKLHPLLAFVSVLGALQAFGILGIFVGPIVASCFAALIDLFNAELSSWIRSSHPIPRLDQLSVNQLTGQRSPAARYSSVFALARRSQRQQRRRR